MSMQPVNREEVKHDLMATLEARREMGPAYDDHFIDNLVERLTREVAQKRAASPPAPPARSASGERLALAICSLIFGIPLVAIASATAGPLGLVLVCLMILGVNFAFNRGR